MKKIRDNLCNLWTISFLILSICVICGPANATIQSSGSTNPSDPIILENYPAYVNLDETTVTPSGAPLTIQVYTHFWGSKLNKKDKIHFIFKIYANNELIDTIVSQYYDKSMAHRGFVKGPISFSTRIADPGTGPLIISIDATVKAVGGNYKNGHMVIDRCNMILFEDF